MDASWDKDKFFAHLDALDESTSSDTDETQDEPRKRRKLVTSGQKNSGFLNSEEGTIHPEHEAARTTPSLTRAATEVQTGSDASRLIRTRALRRTRSEPEKSVNPDDMPQPMGSRLFEGLTFCS